MSVNAAPRRGPRLEYLVAALFQSQSYLVRRDIPLLYGDRQEATDIDVLGIAFFAPLQPRVVICDCKDRQRARPYERVFWARGLGDFVNADETYVALPRANIDIISFARSGHVRVLTVDALEASLGRIEGGGNGYGIANASFFEAFISRNNATLRRKRDIAEALQRARRQFLTRDPYVALNICVQELGAAAASLRYAKEQEEIDLWRLVSGDLIVACSLQILLIASDTIGLNAQEREQYIVERLTYGDVSPRKAREIFGIARALAIEAVRWLSHDSAAHERIGRELDRIDPPPYAQNVIGLVERAISNPLLYQKAPMALDYLLVEQALQFSRFIPDPFQKRFGDSHGEILKICRNVLAFARDVSDLPFQAFWPHQDDYLPKLSTRQMEDARPSRLAQESAITSTIDLHSTADPSVTSAFTEDQVQSDSADV